jgi:hypothetical protein
MAPRILLPAADSDEVRALRAAYTCCTALLNLTTAPMGADLLWPKVLQQVYTLAGLASYLLDSTLTVTDLRDGRLHHYDHQLLVIVQRAWMVDIGLSLLPGVPTLPQVMGQPVTEFFLRGRVPLDDLLTGDARLTYAARVGDKAYQQRRAWQHPMEAEVLTAVLCHFNVVGAIPPVHV